MRSSTFLASCSRAGAGLTLALAACLSLSLSLAACSDDGGSAATTTGGGEVLPEGCDVQLTPGADDQTAVQEALITAEAGSTLCFAAGTFSFTTELSLDVDGVTLRGAGRDQTILDFSAQDTGANGMLIRGDAVTVQDLTVRNTPGDGIRGDSVEGIAFRDMAVTWDADASVENGAYGLYPVGSTDVVIERCLVKGARDAGIYVGQSRGILVADSEAIGNVAGIEIENSTDAIVRDNHAHDNTAGILVFNLPGLPEKDGKRSNVFRNVVENNNLDNFAEPGTSVSVVSPGTGIVILASDDNEFHENEIRGNRSTAVLVLSYLEDLFGSTDDPEYDPYPQGNFIHDNVYEGNGADPDAKIALVAPDRPVQDILWDGCTDATAMDDGHLTNCVSEPSATYLNFNYCDVLPGPSDDVSAVSCTYEPLPTE